MLCNTKCNTKIMPTMMQCIFIHPPLIAKGGCFYTNLSSIASIFLFMPTVPIMPDVQRVHPMS